MKYWMLLFAFLWVSYGTGMARKTEKIVNNGIPWFDDRGEIVNAHGACIVEENGRYYLFGEYKSDKSNAFPGFSCYSSDDLVNWKFERVVLPMQSSGILGPDRVGERVKVMKCPSTGEYVMYMHADDMNYKDPHIGYATCSTIAGEYKLHGPLLYEGKPIRRWDMGTYQDTDGTGYLLLHGGIVYRLSKDYRTAEEKVVSGVGGSHGESPAMFKKDGTYFFLFSKAYNSSLFYTFHNSDIRKVSIFLCVVQSISDYKFIRDLKSRIIHLYILHTTIRFVQKRAKMKACRLSSLKYIHQIIQRIS